MKFECGAESSCAQILTGADAIWRKSIGTGIEGRNSNFWIPLYLDLEPLVSLLCTVDARKRHVNIENRISNCNIVSCTWNIHIDHIVCSLYYNIECSSLYSNLQICNVAHFLFRVSLLQLLIEKSNLNIETYICSCDSLHSLFVTRLPIAVVLKRPIHKQM